jgi:hypothetical protein
MKQFLFVFIFLIPTALFAQRYKTVELKPIAKQGWRYYYDLKKVAHPVALEIPLLALNDEEVNQYYRTSKSLRTAANVVGILPLIFLFTIPATGDETAFWVVLGGTVAAQLSLVAVSHAKLGRAIDRYNTLIFQPSSSSLGIQATWKF